MTAGSRVRLSTRRASTSCWSESTTTAPASVSSAHVVRHDVASAPVCDSENADTSLRPVTVATIGLSALTVRTADSRASPSSTVSMCNAIAVIVGSSRRNCSTSVFVTSTQLPRPTPSPTPTPDSDSRNDNAWFIPPLAATTATGPAAMCSTVGTKLTVAPVGRKKPEVFGPSSRIPVVELISASCSCRATPSAPASANPPEQMTAAPTPQSAASRTASGVAAAGTHSTARSSARPWTSVAACNEGRNDPSVGFGVDTKDRSGVAAASGDGVEHHRSELAGRGRRPDDGDRGGVEEPVES